ncbi:MAG: hypothetical protein NC248_05715 [Bacteroides sp.]|nr:hypothetical protein [Bacteroides sp.]MCM1390250.1 hypothetical protein [Bacteroides sp.]
MKKKIIATCALGLSLLTAMPASAADELLAFPGAEGFGRFTTGGRGGEIYHVTNLNDSGTGSLRDAISKSNRIIVFDVSGVINLKSRLVFKSNQTILGQTAPGEGIQIYGDGVSFSNAHNLIVRYLRIRMGVSGTSGKDAAGSADSTHDQIFDHLSVLWGKDECFSISSNDKANGPSNITIQHSIIGQGLQPHSCGGLIQTDNGVTLFGNLYIENKTRNPKVKGLNQFVNNVLYNWGSGAAYNMGGDSAGDSWAEITDNCFIAGPWKGTAPLVGGNENFKFVGSGNYYDSNRNGVLDGALYTSTGGGAKMNSIAELEAAGAPKKFPEIASRLSYDKALERVIESVGASLPVRDEVDQYVIDELASFGKLGSTGGISTEKSLPHKGTGTLYGGYKPLDSDGDGIPDEWEIANDLDPNDASDAAKIAANGYANIENYVFTIDAAYPYLKNPTEVKCVNNEKTALTFEWKDNSDNEKGFIVEISTDNKNFTEAGRTGANETSLKIENLENETVYYCRVRAFGDNDIVSVYSPVGQSKTVDEPFKPEKSILVAPAEGSDAKVLDVMLQWKNNTPEYFGTTTYDVYLGLEEADLQLIAEGVTETSLNPGELEENTTYYWCVDARNDIGMTPGETWSFKVVPGGTLFYTDFHTTPASYADSEWGTQNAGGQKDMIGAGKTDKKEFDNMIIGTKGGRIVAFGNLGPYGNYSSTDAGASKNAIGFIGNKYSGVSKSYIHINDIEGPWKITLYCGNSDSSAQSVQLSTGGDQNGDGTVNAADDLTTFKFKASSKKTFKFTHTYGGKIGDKVIIDRASLDKKGINFHDILIERISDAEAGIEDIIDNGAATPDVEVLGDAVTVNNLAAGALVQVFDLTGRTVYMEKADNGGSLGFVLANGIYVVRVSDMKPVKIAIR